MKPANSVWKLGGLLATLCVSANACAPRADDESLVRRSLEDGVEVVVTERPRWRASEAWRLSDAPALVIGERTEDPLHLFSDIVTPRAERSFVPGLESVRGPYRLPNGSIAVGDRASGEIRIFDAAGRFLLAALGEGEGPTEIGRLHGLHHCAPGVLTAFDRGRDLRTFGCSAARAQ